MRTGLIIAAAVLAAGGCTYLQQREDLLQGGPQRREAEANEQLQAARTENQNLQDEQVRLEREIERNNKRIAAAQADLDKVSADLEAARRHNTISEAQYRKLKAEVSRTNSELNAVNMQLDAGRVTGNVDVAAKERQIQALEKKKRQLEQALAAPVGR